MKNQLKDLKEEINKFCESTSIHGFSYLVVGQKILTKLLWSFLLLSSLSVATIMIYNTLVDSEKNPFSTTVDVVDITEVPFPAVTFHPGHYRNEKSLLRRMYDYTEIMRYEEQDLLRNNPEFINTWGPVLKQNFFDGTWFTALLDKAKEKMEDEDSDWKKGEPKRMYAQKKGIVKNAAAILATIKRKDKSAAKELEKDIKHAIMENLFKFKGFRDVLICW